ncbi:MAG TPA: hypothetical protein VFQ25_05475 [Ktedonobacterales bacterium]|nr:hypothetical protein [Ktedonobacterales bacterium]
MAERVAGSSGATGATGGPIAVKSRWLRVAHVVWLLVVLVDVTCFLTSIQPMYALFTQPCPETDANNCPTGQAPLADWRAMQTHGITPTTFAAFTIVVLVGASLIFFAVGFLIAWRKWGDLMGLFVSAVLITFGSTGISDSLTNTASGPALLGVSQAVIVALSYPALAAFMLTFPTGKFTPRWTALIVLLWIIQFILFNAGLPDGILFISVLVTWGGCALTQIYRYIKVYTPRERQQTKWVVFGLVIGIMLNNLAAVLPFLWPQLDTPGSVFHLTQIVWLAIFWIPLPLGVGIAILRSRLYDIDVIIRRTVIYGLLTAILAGVYAGGVIGGQFALRAFTGVEALNTPILVVLSTLAVAALFQPLRHRIQAGIDRRFYRQAYDARQALERFSAGLREEVDLPALRQRLTEAVAETVQPTHMSLWLRETPPTQPR